MRLLGLMLAVAMASAQAMELRIAGNELPLRGKVEGNEHNFLKQLLAEHAGIDTVVFGDSPGGDGWSGFRVGELIRDSGLRTVVAGRCYSACTIMFLGGGRRSFAQAARPESVYLAFHGAFAARLFDPDRPSPQGRPPVRARRPERTARKKD